MTGDRLLVFHWRLNVFHCSLWYSPKDEDTLEYRGAVCDCDHWEEHQNVHPVERSCPHIDRVLAYVRAVRETGCTDTSLLEDSYELLDIEERGAPPVQPGAQEKVR